MLKLEIEKHQTCEEQFPGLLARFASTLEVTRNLLNMLVRFGMSLAAETAILADGERLLKIFVADDFLPLSGGKRSRFEGAFFFARDFYGELRQTAERHLRNRGLVSWFEARIETIAEQIGDDSARKLRIEIRAYASAVATKAPYATLRSLILAFEENLVREEGLAVARTVEAVLTPAPAVRRSGRNAKSARSIADAEQRARMKGEHKEVPLRPKDPIRPNGKKARKAAGKQRQLAGAR